MNRLLIFVILFCFAGAFAKNSNSERTKRHRHTTIAEAPLTISNGRLTALLLGSPSADVLQLSDTAFFKGSEPFAGVHIMQLDCDSLIQFNRCNNKDSAVVRSFYSVNGVNFRRCYFASAPDSLVAIRLTADKDGSVSIRVELTSAFPHRVKASKGQLTMLAHTANATTRAQRVCCILRLEHDNGIATVADTALQLTGATAATIYIVARTSGNSGLAAEGTDFVSRTINDAWHTVNFSYDEFLTRHVAYFRKQNTPSANQKQ